MSGTGAAATAATTASFGFRSRTPAGLLRHRLQNEISRQQSASSLRSPSPLLLSSLPAPLSLSRLLSHPLPPLLPKTNLDNHRQGGLHGASAGRRPHRPGSVPHELPPAAPYSPRVPPQAADRPGLGAGPHGSMRGPPGHRSTKSLHQLHVFCQVGVFPRVFPALREGGEGGEAGETVLSSRVLLLLSLRFGESVLRGSSHRLMLSGPCLLGHSRQTRVSGGPSEGDVAAAATCFEVDYEVVATDKVSEGAEVRAACRALTAGRAATSGSAAPLCG